MSDTTFTEHAPRGASPSARTLAIEALKEPSRALQMERFEELLEENPRCQAEVNEHYLRNIGLDLERTRTKVEHDSGHRAATRLKRDAVVRREADKLKRQIVLLSLMMPNGKPMRDCLGEEMQTFGGGYWRIGMAVGSKQKVGDVLDENGVRRLMAE
jgi:hypothetical protein